MEKSQRIFCPPRSQSSYDDCCHCEFSTNWRPQSRHLWFFCPTGQTIFYNVIRSTGWTDQISSHWIHFFDSTRLNHYFFLIFYIMALPNFESCGMSLGCILLPRSQCVSSAAVLDLSASRSVRPDFGPFGNPHICQYRTSGSWEVTKLRCHF